ncbi:hypothetical protein EVAR_62766_1 [Eumeta japonica]|uniref:Uncharacterized protein n=1 Tax=Eumeta variegata TaxID=151549 RepID=A0A4C1ZGI8_EUMVA|nr:hypothetical protein EVAR_62766_1 [Eumeta japonica]
MRYGSGREVGVNFQREGNSRAPTDVIKLQHKWLRRINCFITSAHADYSSRQPPPLMAYYVTRDSSAVRLSDEWPFTSRNHETFTMIYSEVVAKLP